jgi:hypothetical protein
MKALLTVVNRDPVDLPHLPALGSVTSMPSLLDPDIPEETMGHDEGSREDAVERDVKANQDP